MNQKRKEFLDRLQSESPENIVLSHNDLNLSNFMVNEKNRMLLLDYEYSNFNCVYYDYGNFLGEIKFKLTSSPPFFSFDKDNENIKDQKNRIVDYLSKRTGESMDKALIKLNFYEAMSHMYWILVCIHSINMNL